MGWNILPWVGRAAKTRRRDPASRPEGKASNGRGQRSTPAFRALRRTAEPFELSGGLFELSVDGPLGARGDRLAIPFDEVMFPRIMKSAAWQIQDIDFLAPRLDPATRYVLLDIGANVGLFARQAARRLPVDRLICVEPDAGNFAALRYNLSGYADGTVSLWNVGLGSETGDHAFFRDRLNIGNYSLNAESMTGRAFEETRIRVVETGAFMRDILPLVPEGHRLLWKSDTQGHDELIVSRTPLEIWSRVEAAVMELCRFREPAYDRDAFARRIDLFPHRSIGIAGDGSMTTGAVMDYLAENGGVHRDLFLWR